MKSTFTKILSVTALSVLAFAGSTKAQTTQQQGSSTQQATPADTAGQHLFKPSGNLWGYAFGDLYYKSHSDPYNRGGSNQYTGIAKDRNGFQFRRIYLGYDYNISQKFSVELLLAAEDNTTTSTLANPSATTATASSTSGDLLSDNKLSFYIKLANLRIKNIWPGADLVIGQTSTPAFPLLTERIWGYRSVERTVADIRRTPSFDLGATVQGVFDPATKNYGYNLMVGNGQSAKPENDAFKWFYGDIWAKFLDKRLVFDLYGDYEQLGYNTNSTPMYSRNMIKGYVAYTTPIVTFGVEAFANYLKNGAQITNSAKVISFEDQTAQAISMYVHGRILKNQATNTDKLGYFVRYDIYNPDTKYNATKGTYAGRVSNYDPNTKEHFFTAGLDFLPAKNIHFMPNVWLNTYDAQTKGYTTVPPTLTGSALHSYDLVWRATFFYQFGK